MSNRWKHLWTSDKDEWETPEDVFEDIDQRFHFGLDAAASKANAKCRNFIDADLDALIQDWGRLSGGAPVWLNAPYSGIKEFCEKATEQAEFVTVVVLAYMRSDTQWFWNMAFRGRCAELWAVEGRLLFIPLLGEESTSAPAPSAIFVLTPWASGTPKLVPYVQPRKR